MPRLSSPRLLLAALLVVLLPACAERPAEDGDPVTQGTSQAAREHDGTPAPDAGSPVQVSLSAYEIVLSDTVASGPTVFAITNYDDAPHGFAVAGAGVEARLEDDIPARPGDGATQMLRVNLVPGTYRVWCPLDDHADDPMEKQIVVVDVTAASPESVREGAESVDLPGR